MGTVYYIVLVPMVYVAFAVFVIGTTWRGVRIARGLRRSLAGAVGPERRPRLLGALYDTFAQPEVLRTHPVHWAVLVAFHAAFLLLVVGHIELMGDVGLGRIVAHQVFLGSGWVGLVLLAAVLFFLFRRFHSPLRETSVPADYYVLILLFVTALFGSELHLARRMFDYTTIGVEEYREYLSSLLVLRPVLPEAFTGEFVGHSFLLVLHVFCANLVLMLLPSSKMMHWLLALPLMRLRRR